MQKKMRLAVAAVLASGALLGAACGDDDTTEESTAETGGAETTDDSTVEGTDEGEASGDAVEVTAVEYEFQGIPETVPAGTTFSLTNGGEEVHEMIVVKIPDEETRPVEELAQLSDKELGKVFPEGPEAATAIALFAAPGGQGEGETGETEGTVTEPGRYGVLCFVPVGTTEMPTNGPPSGDGPPHFTQGMVTEFTVE